ncbi:MAG: hypothetical protein K8J31_30255, partial [Anaerolineae bacterium]|nr:hypothetical protein [Anaerolineae bacterium]
ADASLLARIDDHAAFDLTLNVLDAQIAAYPVPADCRCIVQVRDFAGAAGTLDLRIEIES